MNRCKTCKHFEVARLKNSCSSIHQVVHPNYYTESKRKMASDGIEITYSIRVGPDYGCVHHKAK